METRLHYFEFYFWSTNSSRISGFFGISNVNVCIRVTKWSSFPHVNNCNVTIQVVILAGKVCWFLKGQTQQKKKKKNVTKYISFLTQHQHLRPYCVQQII